MFGMAGFWLDSRIVRASPLVRPMTALRPSALERDHMGSPPSMNSESG